MSAAIKDALITCLDERTPFRVTLCDGAGTVDFQIAVILGRGQVVGEDPRGQVISVDIDDIEKLETLGDQS